MWSSICLTRSIKSAGGAGTNHTTPRVPSAHTQKNHGKRGVPYFNAKCDSTASNRSLNAARDAAATPWLWTSPPLAFIVLPSGPSSFLTMSYFICTSRLSFMASVRAEPVAAEGTSCEGSGAEGSGRGRLRRTNSSRLLWSMRERTSARKREIFFVFFFFFL